MTSKSVTVSRRVAASPERVWHVVTDVPSAATVLSDVRRVEMLSQPPYGVGTRWRETRVMFGREATEELYVTAADAPRNTVIEAESGGTHYTTTFTIEPDGEGSTLAMEFAGEPVNASVWQGLLWKAFGQLGLKAVSKAMRRDLDNLAAVAEQRDL